MNSKATHNRILWNTRTGVFIALLVVLQYVTAGTSACAGQYITGACVNAVLAVAVLVAGKWSGAAVALLSPFCAKLFGIGPQLTAIIPAISIGNLVFILVLHLLVGGKKQPIWLQILFAAVCAALKFLTVNILVIRLIVPVLADMLKPQQIQTISAMFSYPQLITAFVGGAVALAIVPILRRAIKK